MVARNMRAILQYANRTELTILVISALCAIGGGAELPFMALIFGRLAGAFYLVERFYQPTSGQILLDGHDISRLNIRWLRQQMSLVGQEPVLFSTSIYENILYGLSGSKFGAEDAEKTMQRVIEAAILANAYDFITALPKSYHTPVGERGLQLSGGQRQRIAAAHCNCPSYD